MSHSIFPRLDKSGSIDRTFKPSINGRLAYNAVDDGNNPESDVPKDVLLEGAVYDATYGHPGEFTKAVMSGGSGNYMP